MILIIIGCLMIGAAIGFITAALLKAGADHRVEPTKLLTVGCAEVSEG